MQLHDILRRPLITEKSSRLQGDGKYVFEVALKANKSQIKRAIEYAFGVRVVSVNVVMMPEGHRRVGARYATTPRWKKAVATLQAGDKIEFFEGV